VSPRLAENNFFENIFWLVESMDTESLDTEGGQLKKKKLERLSVWVKQ
jgi:hypothetical protein